MMNKRGGASVGTYLVLIGIVIAVIVGFAYGKAIASFLSGEDKSITSFNKLADKIEELSKKRTTGGLSEAVLIHLENDELFLFFDKDTNSSLRLRLSTFKPIENYPLFKEQEVLEEVLSRQSSLKHNAFLVFNKPPRCQDFACMVLCDSFDLYSPENPSGYLANEFPDIKGSNNNFIVVSCNRIKDLRTFSNIKIFRRKPYFYDVDFPEKAQGPDYLEKIKKFMSEPQDQRFYFYGSILLFCSDYFSPKDFNEARDSDDRMNPGADLSSCPSSKIKFAEYIDENEVYATYQMKDHYVYVEPYEEVIFMCYKPPCTTFEDRISSVYENYLELCLASTTCNSLFSAIDMYADVNKLTFSTKDNKLYVEHGDDYTFSFDRDIDIYVEDIDNERDFFASSVLIEKIELYEGPILKLEANNNKYWFYDLAAVIDKEEVTKPRLIFKVKEWVFEDSDIIS